MIDLTTNSFTASPYPMQQVTDQIRGTVNYVDINAPEVGDTLKFIAGQNNYREVVIAEILESRKPKGNHKDERAVFYSVRYD